MCQIASVTDRSIILRNATLVCVLSTREEFFSTQEILVFAGTGSGARQRFQNLSSPRLSVTATPLTYVIDVCCSERTNNNIW